MGSLCRSGSIYSIIILPGLYNKQRKHSPATEFLNSFYIYNLYIAI